MIDVHAHVLPGIDDGSRNIEESMQMIKEAYEAGFTDIITTSHFIEESYNASKNEREQIIENLNSKIKEEKINLNIYNGAEAFIAPNLIELINEGKLPTLNNTKYLLMELPMNSQIIHLDRIIEDLTSNGYTPIIAHPERYSYVQKDFKILKNLIENGVLLQANYGSIIGMYGRGAQKTVKKLLKNDMIYLLGTDAHAPNGMYLKAKDAVKKLEKIVGKERAEEITTINPQKLLSM